MNLKAVYPFSLIRHGIPFDYPTSLIQYEIDTPLHELANRVGKQKTMKAYSLCAETITGLERLYRATGNTSFRYKRSLQSARHKKDIPALSTESKIRKENVFKTDSLEEEERAERFGVNAPAALLLCWAMKEMEFHSRSWPPGSSPI